jgi:ribosomal protein S18 acetylase RimI-like enzyme
MENNYLVISQIGNDISTKEIDEMFAIEQGRENIEIAKYTIKGVFRVFINKQRSVQFLLRRCETNELIGFAVMRDHFKGWLIRHIAVKNTYKDIKYMDRLIDECIDYARYTIDEPEKIHIYISIKNTSLLEYYKKKGFERVKTRLNYFDNGDAAFRMGKVIEPLLEDV